MSSKRKFVEVEIPTAGKTARSSGIAFTYTPGQLDEGSENRREEGPPRPVYIYSVTPDSPADLVSSRKGDKLRPGDKILTVQGQLVVPLDGGPSLSITSLRELESFAFHNGRAFCLKVARYVQHTGTQSLSDGASSTVSPAQALDESGPLPAELGQPLNASAATSSVSGASTAGGASAATGRLPFDFGFVVADVLSNVPLVDGLGAVRKAHILALQARLPAELLAGGFPPDLRWWSGCRPHRRTRIALSRLASSTGAGLRGVFAALMRDLWFLLGELLPAVGWVKAAESVGFAQWYPRRPPPSPLPPPSSLTGPSHPCRRRRGRHHRLSQRQLRRRRREQGF
jgi:hypothetical protein